MGADAFTSTDEAQALSGGRLHTHSIYGDSEALRNALPHGVDVGPQLGRLKADGGIHIDNVPSLRTDLGDGFAQQDFAVDAFKCLVGVGKMSADIAIGNCAKDSVA